MRTRVYIDGFNLYYGLKQYEKQGVNYRWLDVAALCHTLLPNDTIDYVRYFTATVSGRQDPEQPRRQQVYLRALRTIGNLEIHYGRFLASEIWLPLAHPLPDIPPDIPRNTIDMSRNGFQVARVTKMEEKGSDVNIATYMLLDCFRSEFDQVALISNDTDLAEPIRVIRRECGCRVGVFNPTPRLSATLQRAADFYTQIEQHHLQASLFPATLRDSKGIITKPARW